MGYKKVVFAILAVFIMFALSGCGQSGTAEGVPQATDGSFSGGKEAENINLKSVDVKAEGNDTTVTLSFVSGSRNSGDSSESSIDYVPKYKAYTLSDHARFVVEIPGLQWWDFERDTQYTTEDLANTKVKSLFGLVTYNERPYQLYLQLDADSTVTVTQKSNTLVLKFSPKQTDSSEKYYVIANSFYDYKDGNIAQSYDITPTFCEDLKHKVLISKPFNSESEANQLKNKLLKDLGVLINDEDIKVIKLKTETLPAFSFSKDEMSVYDVAVYAKIASATKQKAEVTLPGGYYLATSNDKNEIAYKKKVQIDDSSSDNNGDQLDELWLINEANNTKEKIGDEYNGIYSAKFSSDGKKLAFLDIDLDSDYSASQLYIYSFETKELRNLSEEGLGNVSTYDWGADSNTLYTVSQLGVAETAQLLKCDLTKSSDSMVSSVKDQQITPNYDGGLTFANGKIYLRDIDESTQDFIIYEIDTTNPSADWVKLANGAVFDVSADSKYMFVEKYLTDADTQNVPDNTDTSQDDQQNSNYSDDEVPNIDLTIINLSTKEQKKIITSKQIYKAGWMDNDTIFYLVRSASSDAAFPYLLKTINADASNDKELCQISGYYVESTGTEDSFYLMDNKEVSDNLMNYVTYTIKKADIE